MSQVPSGERVAQPGAWMPSLRCTRAESHLGGRMRTGEAGKDVRVSAEAVSSKAVGWAGVDEEGTPQRWSPVSHAFEAGQYS